MRCLQDLLQCCFVLMLSVVASRDGIGGLHSSPPRLDTFVPFVLIQGGRTRCKVRSSGSTIRRVSASSAARMVRTYLSTIRRSPVTATARCKKAIRSNSKLCRVRKGRKHQTYKRQSNPFSNHVAGRSVPLPAFFHLWPGQ